MNNDLQWIKDVPDYFGFENLEFEPHGLSRAMGSETLHAKGLLPNGKSYSVIFGEMFYSNGIDTYEIMIDGYDEPFGYQTMYEIDEILRNAQR